MNEKTAAQFKKLLLARRAELLRHLTRPADEEPAPPDVDESTLAPATLDPVALRPDVPARALLVAFDAALTRISEGSYGACTTCGGDIGTRRLVAFPWARQCLACQARTEKQR